MIELPKRPWLTRNVVALGLVSLLTDSASEMIMPFLPLFVSTLPGGGALLLGVIEGGADTVASILKLVAGRLSDKLGRKKPLMLAGYGLSSTVRPFMALALVPWHVLAVRSTDRIGKGLRSSPRDALLSQSVAADHHGAAFGFHRAMDHAGAVIGPLLALAVIGLWTENLRIVFLLAGIPGLLAVLAILFGVREGPDAKPEALQAASRFLAPSRGLRGLLIPIAIFTLGNASDAFLLLKVGTENSSLIDLALLWVGLHVVRSLASTPCGLLADRIGHRLTIGIGWLWYSGVMLGMSLSQNQTTTMLLFLCYGLFAGLTEGPQKALVARLAPKTATGTSFGWYHLTIGLLTLPANLAFGAIWQTWQSGTAFAYGAAMGGLAAITLALTHATEQKPKNI